MAHNVTSFAATNLKGTSIPAPSVTAPPKHVPKTLPHALSRAATSGAAALGPDIRLGKALQLYGGALDKVRFIQSAMCPFFCFEYSRGKRVNI